MYIIFTVNAIYTTFLSCEFMALMEAKTFLLFWNSKVYIKDDYSLDESDVSSEFLYELIG